jgi:PKD repeat protein
LGCKASDAVTITPTVTAPSVIPNRTVCLNAINPTIAIGSASNITGPGITYSWSPATGLSSATAVNPIFTPSTVGTFTYTLAKTESACTSSSSVVLTVSVCSALPLTLLDFTAKAGKTRVSLLDWSTSNEKNVNRFDIEHLNERNDWVNIGTVVSNNQNKYNFEHSNPLIGKNFYRLKMVDNDGVFEYSKTAMVQFAKFGKVSVYPNPTSGLITIDFDKTVTENTNIRVLDMLGKEMLNTTINKGDSKYVLDTETYSKGIYNVVITGTNSNEVIKVVKQ